MKFHEFQWIPMIFNEFQLLSLNTTRMHQMDQTRKTNINRLLSTIWRRESPCVEAAMVLHGTRLVKGQGAYMHSLRSPRDSASGEGVGCIHTPLMRVPVNITN